MQKMYTFKFNYTVNGEKESAEFCAVSAIEAEKMFQEWYLNEHDGEMTSYDIRIACDTEDADEYGNNYGTPDKHNKICKHCHPYDDGTYIKERFGSPDGIEISLIASEETLQIRIKLPNQNPILLSTDARFCPYCGRKFNKKYTWKDLVYANGQVFAEEHPISGEMEDDVYQIDDFISASAALHNCKTEDLHLWTMDGDDFAPADMDVSNLPFGAEMCGAYVNGEPEYL